MPTQYAQSKTAQKAFQLVRDLQAKLVAELEGIEGQGSAWPLHERFAPVEWQRSLGEFGGGTRYVAQNPRLFNRASINVSQVQYENDPSKKLASATALSAIIHPEHPEAPSIHIHISWTELKAAESPMGYWRIMADLNPSHPNEEDTREFEKAFALAVPDEGLRRLGTEQGSRYFHVPALSRHRGVAHFYLEDFKSSDAERDMAFARVFGETIIKAYGRIFARALKREMSKTEIARATQLTYHTFYFLQVLTLDRGTTSGLLVHGDNDVGILGSLPSHVNRDLLKSWLPKLPPLQAELLEGITEILPDPISAVTDDVKVKIATFSREFYKAKPEALDLLARGDIIPPTTANHSSL